MILYRPFIKYKKDGRFAIGFFDNVSEDKIGNLLIYPGKEKIRKINFSKRLIWGDSTGRTFDNKTEAYLLSLKQELIQGFIENSHNVSVEINPNNLVGRSCKNCSIYFDFNSK